VKEKKEREDGDNSYCMVGCNVMQEREGLKSKNLYV